MDNQRIFFQHLLQEHGLPEHVVDSLPTLYAPVMQWIASERARARGPIVVGVNGAQGSGKTTFCSLLVPLLEEIHHLRAHTLSIDDVYLPRDARLHLSQTIHPLCGIRGVPGTHDIPLAHSVFDRVSELTAGDSTALPRFDKALDDRKPVPLWEQIEGPVDVLFFEGWCVGCSSLPPWTGPINAREARDDPAGTWMKWSMEALEKEYLSLFERLNALIFIGVPSMETVRESRWLQEKKLRDSLGHEEEDGKWVGLMTRDEVMEYVDLFERYTEHMLKQMPKLADLHIQRDPEFRYTLMPF